MEQVEDKGGVNTPSATTGGEDAGQEDPALRPNLMDLAVKFLNNPRVLERPMEDKRAFLRKKG